MSTAPENLFDRLGGATALRSIIDEMYRRVLADPELATFFENVSIDRLHQMQFHFLASAFDGPAAYTGAELTAIHQRFNISSHHFAKFCGHFADSLTQHHVDPRDIDDSLGRLAVFKDRVTGDTNVGG